MSDKLVTVATYWNPVEADFARNRLESNGIRTFLLNEHLVGAMWHLGNAVGGVKLQVGDEDAEESLDILAEIEDSHVSVHANADGSQPTEAGGAAERDDEGDDFERPLTSREENADRVLRGAIIGLLFPPLQLYVFWLLLKVFVSGEPLRPEKRRLAIWAAAINFPALMALYLFVRLAFR